MISGRTQVFGLVGHPVRHSLSPAMHNALFAEFDVDAVYVAFDVFPDRAGSLADAIRTLDLRGVNLTVPFKAAILGALSHRTRAVEEAEAANVVIHHDGVLSGYNTDGEGFARGFEEDFGAVAGLRVSIIGAGGAGRAVAAGLADRGAAEIGLVNRTSATAHAERLGAYFPATRIVAGALIEPDVIVNCTPGDANFLDVDALPATAIACDINYWMAEVPWLARCRARGLRTQDGLPMLVQQGALSFELFTGVPVGADHIRARLR